MSESLKIERSGRVLRLVLNRPEKRNALDLALCRALTRTLGEADADGAVGAIVIEGAGGFFCAGMDLKEAVEADPDELLAAHLELFSIGAEIRTPLVAAVAGGALAGGLGLALNAHFVLAAEDARFGLTEIRVGLWPYTIYPAARRAVGERRAVQLALEGRLLGAAEAREWGLVDRLCPPDRPAIEALDLARRLAESSSEAIRLGLEFIAEARDASPEDVLDAIRRFRGRAVRGVDFREGIEAFREKRPARWLSNEDRD